MFEKKTLEKFRVPPNKKISLEDFDPDWEGGDEFKTLSKSAQKEQIKALLATNLEALADAQQLLWADNSHGVLICIQGMDTSGKDGIVKHVMSGMNPLGCQVHSFKAPTHEELDHSFLWRHWRAVPARGTMGIWIRSHYENVVVVRIHPTLLESPDLAETSSFWKNRIDDIKTFEQHLVRNGVVLLKFFLHISQKEQRKRLLERIDDPKKHWKFSMRDVEERAHWDEYMKYYAEAINETSTDSAPWYVIPADEKWIARALVSKIVTDHITSLDLSFPKLDEKGKEQLNRARQLLE